MCIFCSTFVGGMKEVRLYGIQQACRIFCVLGVLCGLCSCGWEGAKEVIATAERMDQTEHVVYDDTAAIAGVIRKLDNPIGRLFCSNTLGKAYYYMGRNLEDNYQQIAEAAECYINADRLQIDDPIYRGRVNSCMGYICTQNNNDSLALIFYNRASDDFRESESEWRYAQTSLNRSELNINLRNYIVADSLLQIAQSYQLDSAFQARYFETRGLYFYEQQLYDSAAIYFKQGLDFWQSEEDKCFSYLKLTQLYLDLNDLSQALPYAQYIIQHSVNPNYLVNAYYCLMLDARSKNDTELLSYYSHARTDAQRLLRDSTKKYAEVISKLTEYLQNPYPWRWVWISFPIMIVLCILFAIGIWIYHRRSHTVNKQLEFEKSLTKILDKYHKPRNHWRNYSVLKKDIAPWLRDWTTKLDTLPLSEQEKIYCIISLIYPHMTDVEIADFICYSKEGIRVFKNRMLKKIGVTSETFTDFLRNLSLYR